MATIIGNLRVVLGLDSASFQAGLKSAQDGLKRAGRGMQQIGRDLSMSVTAPIGLIGAVTVKAAGDFEAAMNRVKAATGATGAELKALEDSAREMGKATQFNAIEAAEGIEILAKNGLDASQIMGGALNASLLLAASAGTDLASAGDIATDVMLQFGKSAEDLTGLVDGINGVLLESKFGIDDYRLALGQAGGVAGGIGVEFEDFNAAIAGTSSLFASGSDAGTSFKTFLQRLVPASGPAAEAMERLNLEFFDAEGNMKSMAEVSQELKDGLEGLSEEARNDALSTIFGTDALRTAIGLANQGADGINRLKAEIAGASAEEQAAARLEGYNGAMRKLSATLVELRIAIGKSGLIEFMTNLVEKLTGVVLRLSESNPVLLKWGTVVAAAAAGFGPLLIGLGLMVAGLGQVAGAIRIVSAAMLANPIALGAAAIGAAAYLIWDNWEQVGPWFSNLSDSLGNILRGLVGVFEGIFTGDFGRIIDGFKQLWSGFTGYWQGLWDGLVGVLTLAWDKLIQPLTDWLGITDDIKGAWEAVRTTFETVMNAVASAFTTAWSTIEPIVTKLSSAYAAADGFYQRAAGGGSASGGTTAPAGSDVIVPPVPVGKDVAAGYVSGVNSGQGAAYGAGTALGAATEQGLRDQTETRSPSQLFARLGGYLGEGLSVGLDKAKSGVAGSAGNLGQTVSGGILPYFSDITSGANSLSDVFQNVKTGFANMLSDMASRMMSSGLSGLIGGLFGGGDKLTGALRGIGLPAIPGFATGVDHFRGGWARINELGGELVKLPGGSTVIPHDISKRMVAGQGGGMAEIVLHAPAGFTASQLGQIEGVSLRVVQSAAPEIVGQSVSSTRRAMNKSKSGFGI